MTDASREWWLDELAHAGAEHLDREYVEGYERKAGYDPLPDVEALQRNGLTTDSVVVDLGAGTGVFAIAAAALCRQVIAVDVSPAMTAMLRSRLLQLGVDNVTVVQGGFLSYEHHGAPADFVFSRNALHQVPDFWKAIALTRAAALLRPGGVMRLKDLVFDFEPSDADAKIAAWLSGAVDDPARGWTAAELAEHVRLEYSTYSWIFEPMIERCGFEIVDREYVRSAYGTYTCLLRAA